MGVYVCDQKKTDFAEEGSLYALFSYPYVVLSFPSSVSLVLSSLRPWNTAVGCVELRIRWIHRLLARVDFMSILLYLTSIDLSQGLDVFIRGSSLI